MNPTTNPASSPTTCAKDNPPAPTTPTLPYDSPEYAEKWDAALESGIAWANATDAYKALDDWRTDPDFDFPMALLFALRIEDRKEVLETTPEMRKVERNRTGYVVPANDSRGRNGWFPLGQPSTFIGFSSVGKTKLLLQMLHAMRTGEKFLGAREVPKKSVLWIQQDRDLESLYDSLEDLFGNREPWFPCEPPIGAQDAAAILEMSKLLSKHKYPEVVIVDGLDILLPDLRGPALKETFPKLQRLARRNGCALIGTWGSPKRQATRDGYSEAEVRLAATGASEIGRLSATAALVSRVEGNEGARKFQVATRRSQDDKFDLMFREDSWLVPTDPIRLAKLKAGGSTDPIAVLKAFGLKWKDVSGVVNLSRASWHRYEADDPDPTWEPPTAEEMSPVCACGCGKKLVGKQPGAKWASDACRKRAKGGEL